jgi:valyl-tRNA synthetase
MKKKQLRDKLEDNKEFIVEFGNWVFEGKFQEAHDVRLLPAILENKKAYDKFLESGIREAQRVLIAADPSLASNLYSTLDQAATELENISMAEITAIKNSDKVRLEKLERLVKAIQSLEQYAGIKLTSS